VYLYRENTEDTINYLIKDRGVTFLDRIWERDKNHPYYSNRPIGADGYKMFLKDYGNYARILFDSAPLPKLSIEISEGNWLEYEHKMLKFFNMSYIEPPMALYPNGKYINQELNQCIEIVNEYLITPNGGRKRLSPKSQNEFYLNDIPVFIRVDNNTIIIEGEQLCDKWTTNGTRFTKI
jgi:hypothetical protein